MELHSPTLFRYLGGQLLHRPYSSHLEFPVKLKRWCDNNSLAINATKTKEIIFSNKRDDPSPAPISIGNHLIDQVDDYKYLGTVLNKKLNFDANTSNIIEKAEKRLL